MYHTEQQDQSSSGLIQSYITLADKNWFQTGGCARFFTEPETAEQFAQALAYANRCSVPIFVLGAGANVLISDHGFSGLIIRPQLKHISSTAIDAAQTEVTAGAGVLMNDLIAYCLANQLGGLEEFSGIPSTVGGALYINLHYFSFFISQFLVRATVICAKTGVVEIVSPSWFSFGYNASRLHKRDFYVVDATFLLKRISEREVVYAQGRRDEMMRQRAQRYPTSNTCGSFFRNFYDNEVIVEFRGKKMIYIAYYLDKIGVKGSLRVGGAQVSYQHANMIVNVGHATSGDIVALARTMQELVHNQFGIIPQPECVFVGFDEYPLH